MRRTERRRALAVLLGPLVASTALAAVLPHTGRAQADFASQAAAGRDTYALTCLECHGDHGQGVPGRSEPTEGRLFQTRNPTALVIFDVVRSGREPNLRALTDDQVWAAIAAQLAANGVDLGQRTLGPDNAATVTTGPAAHPDSSRFVPPGH
jgi:mono/diheme cytochrome c family protein